MTRKLIEYIGTIFIRICFIGMPTYNVLNSLYASTTQGIFGIIIIVFATVKLATIKNKTNKELWFYKS